MKSALDLFPGRGVLLGLFLHFAAVAQTPVTVPEIGSALPGNAAISMPLRWSQGRMQVLIEQSLLPASLAGRTIRAIELRRPAFLGEPGYPALTRTLVVRAAFTGLTADALGADLTANRPANLMVVAGPSTAQVPATAAHGAGEALGGTLVSLTLGQPLAVAAGNLFLELEVVDTSLAVSPFHWVDAVHMEGGVDAGYAVPLGNGGCGSGAAPLALRWTSASPPRTGDTANFTLTGAPPSSMAWILTGMDPEARPASGFYLGFGAALGSLGAPGCFQWTPIDVQLARTTSPLGTLDVGLAYPSGLWSAGQRLGVQAAVLDPAANPVGLGVSNGVMLVMDAVGIGPQCATVLAPGNATFSPWPAWRGLLPVLVFRT